MSLKRFSLSVTAALILGMLAFVFHQWTARRAAEDATEAGRQRQVRLAADVRRAEQRLRALEREQTTAGLALGQGHANATEPPVATTSVRPVSSLPPDQAAARDRLMNDPHAQNAYLAEARTRLEATHGPMAAQLNLTAAQTTRFIDNLLQRYAREMDVELVLEKQPPGTDDFAAKNQLMQQAEQEFRAAQIALLGEEKFQRADYHERTEPVRNWVEIIVGQAALSGIQFSAVQADALIAATAQANSAFVEGHIASPRFLDWGKVLEGAKPILSEPQFAVVRNSVIWRRNMDRLQKLAAGK